MEYTRCFLCLKDDPGRGLKLTSDEASSFILYNILELPRFDSVEKKSRLMTVTYCQGCSEEISSLREMLDDLEDLENRILHTKQNVQTKLIHSCDKSKQLINGTGNGYAPVEHPVDQFRAEIVNELRSANIQSILTKMRDRQLAKKFHTPRNNNIMFNHDSSTIAERSAPIETELATSIVPDDMSASTLGATNVRVSKLRSRGVHILKNVTLPRMQPARVQPQRLQSRKSPFVPSISHPRTSASNSATGNVSSRLRRRLQDQDTSIRITDHADNPNPIPDMALNYPNYNFLHEEPELMPRASTSSHCDLGASGSNSCSQNPFEAETFSYTQFPHGSESQIHCDVKMEPEDYVPIESLVSEVKIYNEDVEASGENILFPPPDNSAVGWEMSSNLSVEHPQTFDTILPGRPPMSFGRRGRPAVRVPCSICGITLQRRGLLIGHMKKRHPEIPFPTTTPVRETRPRPVQNKLITGEDGNEIKCDECGKLFKSDTNRKYHIMKQHRGLANIHCQICGFGLLRKSHLVAHMASKHTHERNFKCQLCTCKYKNQRMLKIHMRKHTGEKPYQCKLCPERFIDSTFLRRHERVKHSERTSFN